MIHKITIETSEGQQNFSYLRVLHDNIPIELKNIPQWVVWFAAQPVDLNKAKKPDKIPLTPNLHAAKTNDSRSWGTFDQVIKTYEKNAGQETKLTIYGVQRRGIIAGVGFVLTPETGITGIDVDKCLDGDELSVFAKDIVDSLGSYTEKSPSGTGIRSFVFAKKPEGGCKHTVTGFEIYNYGRYLTVTGHNINDKKINNCQNVVDQIHDDIFKEKQKTKKRVTIPEKHLNDILQKAFLSKKNGKKIQELYNGIFDTDQSTADLALCSHLAFWLGKNPYAIDDAFRASALMRDKWDKIHVRGDTYGEVTIKKAISGCRECYNSREFNEDLGTYVSIAKSINTKHSGVHLGEHDAISVFDFPNVTEKFKPLSTKDNLEFIMNKYGILCRYNEIKKTTEVVIPWAKYGDDNKMNCAIAEIISLCAKNSMPTQHVQDFITLIASKNSYNPVADWILSKQWDGVSRMQDICDTIKSPIQENLKTGLILRWMISCVACLFDKEFSSHGVLVFVGEQGTGKTSWFKKLVPENMNVVLEGASIDTMNKDTIINAVSHWLVELGELDATFRKSDVSRLKAFITQTNDKIRQPYARTVSEYPRRTVFFGSVNDSKYLVDDTGNRRWWSIPIESINYSHNIDMQQLWAEIYVFYKEGHEWWLDKEDLKLLNSHNEDYQQLDPIEEKIMSSYDMESIYGKRDMTATDVLLELGFDKPNKAQTNLASRVLTKIFGNYVRKKNGRMFSVPSKKTL